MRGKKQIKKHSKKSEENMKQMHTNDLKKNKEHKQENKKSKIKIKILKN